MKTYRIFGIAIVTGDKAELDKVGQVAAGTHHVHRNRKPKPLTLQEIANETNAIFEGGSRKRKEIAPLPKELVERDTQIVKKLTAEQTDKDIVSKGV